MKLLIVEDEEAILNSILKYFEKENYVCATASNYITASEKISMYDYDCVILDLNLPDGSGFDLLTELEKLNTNTGVVIVSARNSVDDRIKGLDLGSDDYITKPFHLSELNARVKALIRRKSFKSSSILEINNIKVDLKARTVLLRETPVIFSLKEYELLLYMLRNAGRVISKSSLAEYLWGDDMDMTDNYDFLYAQIKNVRKKLKQHLGVDHIKTVYGMGYIFEKA